MPPSTAQQDALRRYKADVFSVLSHPTRIHIVELLREGEQSVGALIEHTGIEAANASQHLAILRSKGLVTARKEGNQVFYSLRDQAIVQVLDSMRRLFQTHLEATVGLLQVMGSE
jgi:DNA-binding transcriptional ArsR family regulator